MKDLAMIPALLTLGFCLGSLWELYRLSSDRKAIDSHLAKAEALIKEVTELRDTLRQRMQQ